MKASLPASQRRTNDLLAPTDRLYKQLVTALYERQDSRAALRVAIRLAPLLARFSPKPENIFLEECRSLVYEAKGDLKSAIKHRENEVRLVRRLHQLAQGPDAAHADLLLGQYDYADLRDRLVILAMLYHAAGNIAKAISCLEESKRLCAEHRMVFDADDLLQEYIGERSVTYEKVLEVSENGVLTAKELSSPLLSARTDSTYYGFASAWGFPAGTTNYAKQALHVGPVLSQPALPRTTAPRQQLERTPTEASLYNASRPELHRPRITLRT